MSFTYTRDIPDPPSNPSVDVPNMKTNTNSIDDIWTVDHFSFASANAGIHNRVQLAEINTALPVGLKPINSSTLFAKVAGGAPLGPLGEIFYYRIGALAGIQLTGPGTPVATLNGSSFIAGGILLNWGQSTQISGGSVSFAQNYSVAPFSVLVTVLENNNNRHFVHVKTISTTGFTVASRDSGGNDESNTFSWLAIGI